MKSNSMTVKCCIYWLCLIVAAMRLCAAKQVPLQAAAITVAAAATNGGDSSVTSNAQLRHGSYDNEDNNDDVAAPSNRARRQVSDWFIAPNTRWCGRGNLANGTYNHLGGASAADKCCRKHDHCKLFIPAMSNRYELFNYRPYTMSHCTCDRRFRTCLKMASDEDAQTIGKLFFNMVQTQCFVLHTEHICQKYGTGDNAGTCLHEVVRQRAYLKNNKKF